MELRVLQYFLAVAREQSISGAAESLHLSQPTLSRQLKDLEDELGKQIMIRGNRRITLTDEGMLLRKRAQEIVDLVQKTEDELTTPEEIIAGDIYIGSGETDKVRLIARIAKRCQMEYPQIRYHIASGDACDILEQLDKGLIDIGVLLGDVNQTKYSSIPLPVKDRWGVLMRRDSPLAAKPSVTPSDLLELPLIVSRQQNCSGALAHMMNKDVSQLHIAATYNLIYNGSLMVEEGLGYALTLDKLINTTGSSPLCFRPLEPQMELGMSVVWKKYQIFSKAAEKFLETLQRELAGEYEDTPIRETDADYS